MPAQSTRESIGAGPQTPPEPRDEEILAALDQTGFLLEQRVFRFFSDHDALDGASIGVPFVDPDTGKSREIDVTADYGTFVGDSSLAAPWVAADFIIECKNTTSPFVVVGRTVRKHVGLHLDNVYVPSFDPLALGWPTGVWSTSSSLKFESLEGGAFDGGFEGNQLVRLNRQNGSFRADNNSVYDSMLMPLIKATLSRMPQASLEPEDQHPSYNFYFPLLVINSPIYTVTVGSKDSKVQRVPWAPIVRQLQDGEKANKYLVEVVEFTHLETYVEKRAMKLLRGVENALAQNARMFNPYWLLKQYGKPTRADEFLIWKDLYKEATGIGAVETDQ
ncbi:hypothetical protein [Micromonospora peucetia]|uniref:Uncharacterized protein n=1 Tax=Micromonospora peucetia TaxID=47871 RepID=A0ABZ1EDQ1_9ACTN|nr:hypothetical protein [Micromonospora peucetia]WSA32657.1 hypothetical protein OIE14_00765 [Micromonospora peucetia]